MAETDKEILRDEHIKIVEKCQNKGRGLTEWESNFLQSILDQMGNGNYLSSRQSDILYRIYEERVD
jgi:hypothetical protein